MSSSEDIREVPLRDALGDRYLAYALSTIVSRSLPDVRDGLKPVHRRLLYAMRLLRLDPNEGFKKCARVVGDVIGRFHPHGDVAVYDALVRLAQDFAVRYPLVEGQGNFGNVDGDNAAAMRYTEARLTPAAMALLQGLDEDAVDFRATYDGEDREPVVLPAAIPNLLANGAAGIAVGMATSIPPHNLAELCDAALHLIAHPDADTAALLQFVRGPDFPTGGCLIEDRAALQVAYATGKGSLRLRARWQVERLSHGLYQIVVTEIPYQVGKSRLIERIADLVGDKKLAALADVRDESTDLVRIVLEPRSRTVDPDALMERLFRETDLEVRVTFNMTVLDGDGVPRVMSLPEILSAWLAHRQVVLRRRATHRLGLVDRRLEILDGLLLIYLNLDEVIRIIREEDEPREALMAAFSLTQIQADAILDTRLRALRKLEETALRKEHRKLTQERGELRALLADDGRQWATIRTEIEGVRKAYGPDTALGRRRTDFIAPETVEVAAPLEDAVEREPVTVVLSEKGWVRAVRGHGTAAEDLKFKEGDAAALLIPAQTTDKLLILGAQGRVYTLGVDKIPRGKGFGEPLRLFVDLPADVAITEIRVHRPGGELILASSAGRGFRVAEADLLAQTRAGKQVLVLGKGETAGLWRPVEGDAVACVGQNRKLLVFPLEQIPGMAKGRGVRLQAYKDGGIADLKCFLLAEGLTWPRGEQVRREKDLGPWLGTRAQAGRLAPQGFPRDNRFA